MTLDFISPNIKATPESSYFLTLEVYLRMYIESRYSGYLGPRNKQFQEQTRIT